MKKIILISFLIVMVHSVFAQEALPNDNAAESKTARNTLTFNPFHALLGNVQFSYERILPSGKISLVPFVSVPVFPLVAEVDFVYFNAGMGVRYYPTGQGRIKYYTGFSASGGYLGYPGEYYYYPMKFFSSLLSYNKDYYAYDWFGSTLIHNGVVVYPGKERNFNMGLNLGVGAVFIQAYWYSRYYDYDNGWWVRIRHDDENVVLPTLEFSFTLGFKF